MKTHRFSATHRNLLFLLLTFSTTTLQLRGIIPNGGGEPTTESSSESESEMYVSDIEKQSSASISKSTEGNPPEHGTTSTEITATHHDKSDTAERIRSLVTAKANNFHLSDNTKKQLKKTVYGLLALAWAAGYATSVWAIVTQWEDECEDHYYCTDKYSGMQEEVASSITNCTGPYRQEPPAIETDCHTGFGKGAAITLSTITFLFLPLFCCLYTMIKDEPMRERVRVGGIR